VRLQTYDTVAQLTIARPISYTTSATKIQTISIISCKIRQTMNCGGRSSDGQDAYIIVDGGRFEVAHNMRAAENLGMRADFVTKFTPPAISCFLINQFGCEISQVLDATSINKTSDPNAF
jgi:hypothetical protein